MGAARKSPKDDFENRYLDLFEDTVKSMDKKIDKLDAKQTDTDNNVNRLNTKVNRLENEVFPNQAKTVKELPSWYRDPNIIKLLLAVVGVISLFIYLFGALKGVHLPGVP